MSLQNLGFEIFDYPHAEKLKEFLIKNDFANMDKFLIEECKKGNGLFQFLAKIHPFEYLEHIIAIREVPDDDGIWHDDGSRLIGFSLSLNLDPTSIQGGLLNIRKKNSSSISSIPPLPFGKIVVFLTGQYDFEHKVDQVTGGKRIVIAGWGSKEKFNYN